MGDLEGLGPVRVNQLLRAFTGQPLIRLILYNVIRIDPPTVSRIAKAFPVLRHLTLLTDCELVSWPGELDTYAQAIAGLPLLESLAWNNFFLEPSVEFGFLSFSNDMLGWLYAGHVRALLRHVHHLRCIKITIVTDGIVDTIDVRRSKSRSKGGGDDTVEVRRVFEAALHTSSWSVASDALQDT